MDQIIFNNHPNFPWKQTNGETMCKDFWAGGMNVKEENEVYERTLTLKEWREYQVGDMLLQNMRLDWNGSWREFSSLQLSFVGSCPSKFLKLAPFFFSSFFIKREEAHSKFETQGWVH